MAQTYHVKGTTFANTISAKLTIVSLSQNQLVFTFENTSSVASKLTGIGFDFTNTGVFTNSGSVSPYTFIDRPNNQSNNGNFNALKVPQYNGVTMDFALALGGQFNGGGSPNAGLSAGQTSSQYTILSSTNSFSGITAAALANNVYIRFKAIGSNGQGSDVAHNLFTPSVAPVPEPGEYAVMGMIGLTLCGLMVRARRRKIA
ncbi:MAG: hypothetical protein OHK0029_34140 [Armatimonadaceae bacterium]